MIQTIGNKLQVEIDAGGEKTKKITFTNVMDEPSEEKVLDLSIQFSIFILILHIKIILNHALFTN